MPIIPAQGKANTMSENILVFRQAVAADLPDIIRMLAGLSIQFSADARLRGNSAGKLKFREYALPAPDLIPIFTHNALRTKDRFSSIRRLTIPLVAHFLATAPTRRFELSLCAASTLMPDFQLAVRSGQQGLPLTLHHDFA